MDRNSNGSDIVAGLANGRPWWKLSARDVGGWASTLHPSATEDRVSRLEWIGNQWDGSSDIQVGAHVVRGAEVALLIGELRRLLSRSQIDGITLPAADSVRQNFFGVGARQSLTIDFDLGDLVLPITIEEMSLRSPPFDDMTAVAVRMIEILFQTGRYRHRMLKRELRLRHALEETAARIGYGAAPLWLRIASFPIDEDVASLATWPYLMLLLRLDECLMWSPTGSERIRTVKEIRDYHGFAALRHRRRAAALTRMITTGSRGWISEVALSLIKERGLDPCRVFDEVRSAGIANRRGAVEFGRNGTNEKLHYVDGAVQASMSFNGGHYGAGQLMLWGAYPETLALSAKGRRLASFVDHPAFRDTGVKVSRAVAGSHVMELTHETRLIPVEDTDPAAPSRT